MTPWVVSSLVMAVLGGPIHWTLWVLGWICLGLVRWWDCSEPRILLGIAVAPWWAGAAINAGGWGKGLVLVVGLALVVQARNRLSWVALCLGLVEGVRALVLSFRGLEAADGVGLITLGVGVGAALCVPSTKAAPMVGWGLLLASIPLGWAWSGHSDLASARQAGLLERRYEALVDDPALGLEAISLSPQWHDLAGSLLPALGHETLLEAGWRPEVAPLHDSERVGIARWLEQHGRGGEAERLLQRGITPQAQWWRALIRTLRHEPSAPVLGPPAGIGVLPGSLQVEWWFFAGGMRSIDVHVEHALDELVLIGRAEGQGNAQVSIDGGPWSPFSLASSRSRVVFPVVLPAGPHRITVAFDEKEGPEDQNVYIERILGAAPGG